MVKPQLMRSRWLINSHIATYDERRQNFHQESEKDIPVTRILALCALVLLAGVLTFGTPGHTQGYATENNTRRASPSDINDVVRGFTTGSQRLCGNVPDPAYTVDCVADYFDWLADRLPQTQEFWEARSIISGAASEMNRVARDNASATRRPAVIRLNNSSAPSGRTSRVVIPVAPERQAAARSAAVAIVEEAETQLLRASERSQRSKLAYTNIAAAIGNSSLILLRSG